MGRAGADREVSGMADAVPVPAERSWLRRYFPLVYQPLIILLLVFFLASGVMQPTTIEIIRYQGACEPSTFLFLLPNYVGMCFAILMPSKKRAARRGGIPWRRVTGITLLDVVGQGACYLGLVLAGSGIYTVLYASVTVWTAVLSRLILRRQLSWIQWGACLVVTAGVAISAVGARNDGQMVVVGAVVVLGGSMLHALTYVFMEMAITRPTVVRPWRDTLRAWMRRRPGASHAEPLLADAPPPRVIDPLTAEQLAALMGAGGTLCYMLWMAVWTIPRWTELVTDVVAARHGDVVGIAFAYVALVAINLIHALTFYNVLGKIGSVTAGILKGLQAVCVFVVSHFVFCQMQESQCFTATKGVSLVIVALGVFAYSLFPLKTKPVAPPRRVDEDTME